MSLHLSDPPGSDEPVGERSRGAQRGRSDLGGPIAQSLATLRSLGAPGIVLAVFAFIVVFPGALSPQPAFPCALRESLQPPSLTHPLGTDLFGCDYLARTLEGARTSVVVGLSVLLGAMLIALVLGALAGWYGGWVDAVVSSASDIVFSIPALLGALVILSITGVRTMFNVILLLTVFSWPPMVRLVRAVVQTQAKVEHAEAARAEGAADAYTLRRHVLPYSLRPLFVFGAPYTATIISAEAVLSFVGAGLQEPINSWGLMLADAQGRFTEGVEAFHLLAPAVPLTLLVWALLRVSTRLRARTPT